MVGDVRLREWWKLRTHRHQWTLNDPEKVIRLCTYPRCMAWRMVSFREWKEQKVREERGLPERPD